MAANDDIRCFIEWKEHVVTKEWGKRVVHYYLKDAAGESLLAVVGTERSFRHMFYVISEDFLRAYGGDNSPYAGYTWKARREVMNWLTSLLSKQHQLESPKGDLISAIQQIRMLVSKGRHSRNLKVHTSGIVWSGEPWACGKQLKHYPAFCRSGITIAIQSFVFVLAEEENYHLAYLEDMYEDRKGQKKVKVRWFQLNQEVKNVVSIKNSHPKEVFITPNVQVISVECVDGPAIVVTREHYDEFLVVLPQDVLDRVHLCSRQFKSNRVKPFKLNKLGGYFDQPIFSFLDRKSVVDNEFKPLGNVKPGSKRTRSYKDCQPFPYESTGQNSRYGSRKKLIRSKSAKCPPLATTLFKVNDKIEVLCQDSGIRGCWFRCTVLKVSRHMIRVLYDDLKDADDCSNLEEWIPAFRYAVPDKHGMRHRGRPTIRPSLSHFERHLDLVVGDPVDVWWSDGWWEGVLIGTGKSEDGILQILVPSESWILNVHEKNLRASRDWVGDQWLEVEANGDIVSAIPAAIIPDDKISPISAFDGGKSDDIPALGRTDLINGGEIAKKKLELDSLAPQNSCPVVKVNIGCSSLQDTILENPNSANEVGLRLKYADKKSNDKTTVRGDGKVYVDRAHDHSSDATIQNGCDDDDMFLNKDDNDNRIAPEEFETSHRKCEPALMEVEDQKELSIPV